MVTVEESECRVCGEELNIVCDLGEIYPSNFIEQNDSEINYQKVPLKIAQCSSCGLYQLKHTVNLDSMYRTYWYRSGLNKSMLSDLKDVVVNVEKRIELNPEDVVVDIGCNDASLFKFYSTENLYKVGFDPALNLNTAKNSSVFINEYFTKDAYPTSKKAKVVTSIAMFYDLPDPNKFIYDVYGILDIDGIWVIQFTDLYSMIKLTAFDNICHEHLEYYDINYLNKLLQKHGFKIFDMEYNKVNGGSVRLYICKSLADINIEHRVSFYLEEEAKFLKKKDVFKSFFRNIKEHKESLVSLLQDMHNDGISVYGLGASTKGNTLLQYYGLDKEILPYIYEVNTDKFGLKTLGTNITIIPEDTEIVPPQALLLLPWHFIDNILVSYDLYLRNGGMIITPLPEVTLYYYKDGCRWELTKKQLRN